MSTKHNHTICPAHHYEASQPIYPFGLRRIAMVLSETHRHSFNCRTYLLMALTYSTHIQLIIHHSEMSERNSIFSWIFEYMLLIIFILTVFVNRLFIILFWFFFLDWGKLHTHNGHQSKWYTQHSVGIFVSRTSFIPSIRFFITIRSIWWKWKFGVWCYQTLTKCEVWMCERDKKCFSRVTFIIIP